MPAALVHAGRADSEFAKLTRIKGLAEWKVIWKHCFAQRGDRPDRFCASSRGAHDWRRGDRERLSWLEPGCSRWMPWARDFQVVQAVVQRLATIYILTNQMVDILYAYLDPRIRYQ
jgi:peptide/nickel transport system permease protein